MGYLWKGCLYQMIMKNYCILLPLPVLWWTWTYPVYYAYGSGGCNNLQRYSARLGETIDRMKISKKSMKLWSAIKEEKHFFIFLYKGKHFAELWTAVSYFALEVLVEWCSAKIGILLKTALKYKPLEPLTVNGGFLSRVAGRKPATLFKKWFPSQVVFNY